MTEPAAVGLVPVLGSLGCAKGGGRHASHGQGALLSEPCYSAWLTVLVWDSLALAESFIGFLKYQ